MAVRGGAVGAWWRSAIAGGGGGGGGGGVGGGSARGRWLCAAQSDVRNLSETLVASSMTFRIDLP
jgi:hypothetical protein